jgi:O-antigen/teichoic acid export membrane protein
VSLSEQIQGDSGARDRPRRIARNTAFSGIGEGSNLLLFLLAFLAARYLAPQAFGYYTTALAFVSIFRVLPDFGMAYASTLAISRDRSLASRLTGNLLGFQAVLSLATVVLCLGIAGLVFNRPEDRITWTCVLVLSLDLVLKTIKGTLRWLLKGLEHFGVESLSLLLERVLLLVVGVAVLRASHGPVPFVLVFLCVRLPDTLGLWAYINARVVPLHPAFDAKLWRELFRKGLPFAYAGVVITLFFQVDQVLLEQMRGALEVGWYGAPVRVLEGLTLVSRILGYALIPTMAALFPASPEAVTALYRRGCKYLLLVGLPIAAFGFLSSETFIPFLFGPAYLPSIPVSRILIPASAFMFLSNFGETTLACVNRWGTIVVVATLALLVNVGLNLALIPASGYLGAAQARIATEAVYFLLTAGALRAYGHRVGWLSLGLKPLLLALLFALVLWLSRGLGLLGSAALASAVWVLSTFLFGVWDQKERDLLGRFLPFGR